jgi:hypothetical protein
VQKPADTDETFNRFDHEDRIRRNVEHGYETSTASAAPVVDDSSEAAREKPCAKGAIANGSKS